MSSFLINRKKFLVPVAFAWILFVCIGWSGVGSKAVAYDGPVEKKVFELARYKAEGGAVIQSVRMGYETYGKLNERGDNAILVPPFFGGTSHAAGKYAPTDRSPGYWDGIIGPGKPLDTDKFFVIGVDGLANLQARDGKTVSTGPASIDPATGRPYAMRFPTITIRDFVNVEKALLDHLGVKKLHAVMGASMGGMQTFEWGAAYPDMVERIIPVVAPAQCDGYTIASMESMRTVIMLDPRWNHGDYYGRREPLDGVRASVKALFLKTRGAEWFDREWGRRWASPDKDPSKGVKNLYAVEEGLDRAAAKFATLYDANHILVQVRAIQIFSTGDTPSLADGMRKIKAKVLLLPARNDLLFPLRQIEAQRDLLLEEKKPVRLFVLEGLLGHLTGILEIGQASDEISRFLAD